MEDKLVESIFYILPAIVTGYVAYYMFNSFVKQQVNERKMAILAERKKQSLPIKLQAYERMILFCERINPVKMLARVNPISTDIKSYKNLLIQTINQEFEHNLVQQIYISNETWIAILAAKQAVIQKIRQVAETSNSANDLRENILIDYAKSTPPTDTAIAFIKNEVKKLI